MNLTRLDVTQMSQREALPVERSNIEYNLPSAQTVEIPFPDQLEQQVEMATPAVDADTARQVVFDTHVWCQRSGLCRLRCIFYTLLHAKQLVIPFNSESKQRAGADG